MNSLSWMIYLAEATGRLHLLLGLAAIGFLVAWVSTAFISTVGDYGPFETPPAWRPRLIIVAACLMAVKIVIPSTVTVYAIAASEMGEDVLNSKTGGKAVRALDAWLDRQIAGEPKKSDD